MMIVTKTDIVYEVPPYGKIGIIPKGTEVLPSTNLPECSEPKFWAKNWKGMTEKEKSWANNYGFLLFGEEVENKRK